jgi:hypothetical protein
MTNSKPTHQLPETLKYTKYYEHDGALRAYANRAMVMAGLFGLIALTSLGFAIYVRMQPPTVIRVDANGDASVVGEKPATESKGAFAAISSTEVAPTDVEGRAVVRRFLERYLSYTPTSVDKQLADALNMMTANLRQHTMNILRDQDVVGKIKEENITSRFKIRSIDVAPGQPWVYAAYGVKEVHRVRNKAEYTDRIVGKYLVRLIQERRSESVPSGLLVAEYGEQQMVGEKDLGLAQGSALLVPED